MFDILVKLTEEGIEKLDTPGRSLPIGTSEILKGMKMIAFALLAIAYAIKEINKK